MAENLEKITEDNSESVPKEEIITYKGKKKETVDMLDKYIKDIFEVNRKDSN